MDELKIKGKIFAIKIGIIVGTALLAIALIMALAGAGTGEEDSESINNSGYTSIIPEGEISLKTSSFGDDFDTFKKALEAYYNKISGTKKQNFYANFLSKADTLWNASLENGVNPEVIVITARQEGAFKEAGGSYNYWGIGVYNGQSKGVSYASFADGIAGYAGTLKRYEPGGEYADEITSICQARQESGCDSTGYGMPGSFSGMQSVYSDLGKHVTGSSGTGGYYYMDPDRAGVTKIYATHEEFLSKCKNAGGVHEYGKKCTDYERGQFTAYQVEMKYRFWNEIFGDYAP